MAASARRWTLIGVENAAEIDLIDRRCAADRGGAARSLGRGDRLLTSSSPIRRPSPREEARAGASSCFLVRVRFLMFFTKILSGDRGTSAAVEATLRLVRDVLAADAVEVFATR
jgi:hypothetical protein